MQAVIRFKDTDADAFIGWLSYYTRDVIPRGLSVGEDVSLILHGPQWRTVDVGLAMVQVNGVFYPIDDEDKTAPDVFKFRLVSLPFEQLRVEAECYDWPGVVIHFLGMLASILQDWRGRAALVRLGPLSESVKAIDRELTTQDRRLILRAMELENGLLATMHESEAEEPEPQPDTPEPARREAGGEVVGELPPEPQDGTAQEWISWMHDMARAGHHLTLREVSRKSGHAYGTIKNAHEGCPDPDCPIRRS